MNIKVVTNGAACLIAKRLMGPFRIRRQWLDKTQWLSEANLQEIQLTLLKRLVRHCYNSVPYYRRLMDNRAIRADGIRTLDDIRLFPILTKKNVLEAEDSIISTRYPRWTLRAGYSGGTTGTPITIYRNLFSIQNEHAFVRRQWDWAGIGMGDRCAYLTGRVIAEPNRVTGPLYAYDPLMKELILSTYHLSTHTAKDYAQAIKDYQAVGIVGYPSSVSLLAQTCLVFGIKIKLRAALTSSETLTGSMRNTIAEAFGCKVFDFYGAAERVCYIHTCEHGSYHIIPEYGLTELIPASDSDGKYYKVIATGFWNLPMPLIRYDTGDIVTKSNGICPCGRALPVVKSIQGRQADVITTPSGRKFGAAILTHLLYGTNHIVESQIIQDALDRITIKYVPAKNISEKNLADFVTLIHRHLPSELKVTLQQVSAIERTNSGKIRPVVSKIA